VKPKRHDQIAVKAVLSPETLAFFDECMLNANGPLQTILDISESEEEWEFNTLFKAYGFRLAMADMLRL